MKFKEYLQNKKLMEKVVILDKNDLKHLSKDQLLTRYYNLADEIANKNENHPDYEELVINFNLYKNVIDEHNYKPFPFDDSSNMILKRRKLI